MLKMVWGLTARVPIYSLKRYLSSTPKEADGCEDGPQFEILGQPKAGCEAIVWRLTSTIAPVPSQLAGRWFPTRFWPGLQVTDKSDHQTKTKPTASVSVPNTGSGAV